MSGRALPPVRVDTGGLVTGAGRGLLGGVTDGDHRDRQNVLRDAEAGADAGDAVFVRMHAQPDRAQPQKMGGQQQVFHSRAAVLQQVGKFPSVSVRKFTADLAVMA